jgi:hypothetical protein
MQGSINVEFSVSSTAILLAWYSVNRCKNRRYHPARTGVKTEGTILPEQVLKQKVPYCQNRCKNRRYHTARTGVKTEDTCSGSMVPSVLTPVLAVWYLLFLHLFWQYGTFCFYTCSGSMVPSVFTPVLTEGTILP